VVKIRAFELTLSERLTQLKSSFCISCSLDRESCCRALQQTCDSDLFSYVNTNYVDGKAVSVGLESLEDMVWVKWLMKPCTCASEGATTVCFVTSSVLGVPASELSVYSACKKGI